MKKDMKVTLVVNYNPDEQDNPKDWDWTELVGSAAGCFEAVEVSPNCELCESPLKVGEDGELEVFGAGNKCACLACGLDYTQAKSRGEEPSVEQLKEDWTAYKKIRRHAHEHERPVMEEIMLRAGLIWRCKAQRKDVYGTCGYANFYSLDNCSKCHEPKAVTP